MSATCGGIAEIISRIKMKKIASLILLCTVCASSVNAFCFKEAAQAHRVNETVLFAIAKHESRLDPNIEISNRNGSIDVGLAGINSVHLPMLETFGITKEKLLNPCVNLYVAAWLLSKKIQKYGNTWHAIGAYHSETIDKNLIYRQKIMEVVKKELSR